MTIGLVLTVRNERNMLRTNVQYHHFLGVERCWVFDDGSDDGTLETVADLDYVVARRSVDAHVYASRVELQSAAANTATYLTARQVLNTVAAMDEARASGLSWMIAIDADELVAVDLERAEPGALRSAMEQQPASVEALVFRPLEIVQRRLSYANVMAEETMFKRADAKITRDTYDPFANTTRRISAVYGHTAGKMAARLDGDAVPRTPHKFVHRDGSPLRSRELGHLLHYYSHDVDAFVRKFRLMHDHPDRHLQGGEVVLQKRLWRDVVNRSGMDDEALREYYRRWVMFGEDEVEKLARQRGGLLGRSRSSAVVEVRTVQSALAQIGDAAAASRH